MSYTLDRFSADCRSGLLQDPGPAGRDWCANTRSGRAPVGFVARHLGPEQADERKILYEDPDLRFCILAHVYRGAKSSAPHDHGPSWAVWPGSRGHRDDRLAPRRQARRRAARKVEKVRTYGLSPARPTSTTRATCSPRRRSSPPDPHEGVDLTAVKRDKFEAA